MFDATIQLILDGCVIFENCAALDRPPEGKSFSTWIPEGEVWERNYVDTAGGHRKWIGKVEGGELVFYRNFLRRAEGQTANELRPRRSRRGASGDRCLDRRRIDMDHQLRGTYRRIE